MPLKSETTTKDCKAFCQVQVIRLLAVQYSYCLFQLSSLKHMQQSGFFSDLGAASLQHDPQNNSHHMPTLGVAEKNDISNSKQALTVEQYNLIEDNERKIDNEADILGQMDSEGQRDSPHDPPPEENHNRNPETEEERFEFNINDEGFSNRFPQMDLGENPSHGVSCISPEEGLYSQIEQLSKNQAERKGSKQIRDKRCKEQPKHDFSVDGLMNPSGDDRRVAPCQEFVFKQFSQTRNEATISSFLSLFPSQYEKETLSHKKIRYYLKKKERVYSKKVTYKCRKSFAEKRARVKGRFVKAETKPQQARQQECNEYIHARKTTEFNQ